MYVVARILEALLEGERAAWRLAARARVNPRRLSQYLAVMEERGLVARDGEYYVATERGADLYHQIREIIEQLTDADLQDAVRRRGKKK